MSLQNLEEVILEFVSGFSDLSPLRKLSKLKSLHLENLRKVTDFGGLNGLASLRYLHIDGTLAWNQPINDFSFLAGLPNLEVFSLGFIINKSPFPVLRSVLELINLKKVSIGRATFYTSEYAFLETALPSAIGAKWDLWWDYEDKFDFLGKGAGYVKKNSSSATQRCELFEKNFIEMKLKSRSIIDRYHRKH